VTRRASPDDLAIPGTTRLQLDFLVTAHALTGVTRVNQLVDGSRAETSAEHSWHLALAAAVLAGEHAPEVDLGRVLTMLTIHDLVEVDAGDVPIYDEQARVDVVADEELAASRLFGMLPAGQSERFLALWHEFEAAESSDARFARAIDRLQPLLLHWAGDGTAWSQREVTVEQERRLMAVIGEFWPSLEPVCRALIDNAHSRGMLRG
jgi:5'-deoxynucleotidase YfbR-like HD superfamily hydrolase